ncbi:hypothetical protein Pyn_10832 [Prunus yedoensis var. nudiflora]|uniref:Uncharacterized protein n=1 Tax=Prunus yedoensis var. nudiflora TaxID=2094558 RepID=A0A314XR72_PRUYE|nr:hypothetical protein Pyn_10832 [Prunus yedoensis var. nudiflora]
MEVQMKPVTEQLDRVKDLAFPEFGSLQDWEASGRPKYIKTVDVEVEVEFCWVEGQVEEVPSRQIRVKSKRDEDPAEGNVDWEEDWGPNDLEC